MKRTTKQTVLVAEDSELLMRVYEIELKDAGFKLISTADGDSVFHLAKSKNPDIILLDMYLPNKNGEAILVDLKNHDKSKDIPVIVTSNCNSGEGDRMLAAGACDFIIKANYSPNEIIDRIKKHLSKKKK